MTRRVTTRVWAGGVLVVLVVVGAATGCTAPSAAAPEPTRTGSTSAAYDAPPQPMPSLPTDPREAQRVVRAMLMGEVGAVLARSGVRWKSAWMAVYSSGRGDDTMKASLELRCSGASDGEAFAKAARELGWSSGPRSHAASFRKGPLTMRAGPTADGFVIFTETSETPQNLGVIPDGTGALAPELEAYRDPSPH